MAKMTGKKILSWMLGEPAEEPKEEEPALDWNTFQEALEYGYDHEQDNRYQAVAKERDSNAVRVATADFLYVPEIDDLDVSGYHGQVGDVIRVRAHDDVIVTEVRVIIVDNENHLIEKGPAAQVGDAWEYRATKQAPTQHVRIGVTAADLPGHKGKAHVDKQL